MTSQLQQTCAQNSASVVSRAGWKQQVAALFSSSSLYSMVFLLQPLQEWKQCIQQQLLLQQQLLQLTAAIESDAAARCQRGVSLQRMRPNLQQAIETLQTDGQQQHLPGLACACTTILCTSPSDSPCNTLPHILCTHSYNVYHGAFC